MPREHPSPPAVASGTLTLYGLTGDEQLSLREKIKGPELEIKTPRMGGARAGEPITIAIIALGKVALTALAAFLLKKRRKAKAGSPARIRVGTLVVETNGTRIEANNLEIELAEEASTEEDVIRAISGQLQGALDQYLGQK